MITKKQLTEIAKINNNSPSQQEKHYIQSLILYTLSEEKLIFKGGTYLWFFHGLNRFSEDLDFTATNKINFINKKIIKTLNLFDINATISKKEKKNNSMTFRVDAEGPLYTNELSKNFIYVEISLREKIETKPELLLLKNNSYLLPEKNILGMSLEEVASEKIRAIITRNKPRDIYDLNFLIKEKQIKFNKNLIQKKLDYYNKTFSIEEFNSKIKENKKDYHSEMNYLTNNKLPSFEEIEKNIINWINKD